MNIYQLSNFAHLICEYTVPEHRERQVIDVRPDSCGASRNDYIWVHNVDTLYGQ